MFRSLFDPNSAFFRGMERVWTLVVLNVLWVLCSLPVVTIGPSTAALYQVLGKVIQGEDSHTARKFFAAWRENFKCALLVWLPMLAVLALPPDMTDTFWHLALYGGLTATAVEYAVHFCCDRLLGVMFWDYSSTKMDLNRRVCLPFALIWGPLAAMTARYIHPLLRPWLTAVPPWLTLAVWLLLTADSFFTVRLLLQYHDIDLLGWKNLLRRRSAA